MGVFRTLGDFVLLTFFRNARALLDLLTLVLLIF
jgi:hypothetical protein